MLSPASSRQPFGKVAGNSIVNAAGKRLVTSADAGSTKYGHSFEMVKHAQAALDQEEAGLVFSSKPGASPSSTLDDALNNASTDLTLDSALTGSKSASTTFAAPSNEVMVDVSAIPDTLVIEVKFPDPPALPPVESLTPVDCVRELAAIYCMREAETAAALEACDRVPHGQGSFASPASASKSSSAIHGSVEVSIRSAFGSSAAGPGSPHASARSSGWDGSSPAPATPPHSQLDEAEAIEDDIEGAPSSPFKSAVHPSLFGLDRRYVSIASGPSEPHGAFAFDHFLADRNGVAVRAVAGTVPTAGAQVSAASVAAAPAPTVRLVLSLPSQVHARTLAFDVPRTALAPNSPYVGAAAAQDAVAALRVLMASAVSIPHEAQGRGGIPSALDGPDQVAARISHAVSLLAARVRPWIHSGLSPAASEARVQALVDRVKDLTGYDVTPPMAPLAQTRLGTAHVRPSPTKAKASGSWGSSIPGNSFKRYFASKPGSLGSTPARGVSSTGFQGSSSGIVTAGSFGTPMAARYMGALARGKDKAAPVFLGAAGGGGVAFSLTARALFHSPNMPSGPHSAVRRRNVFGSSLDKFKGSASGSGIFAGQEPLVMAAMVQAAPEGVRTPDRPAATRALARYVSARDQTRDKVDPASLDRVYHAHILAQMQQGLQAMSEQRRAEEGHMLSCTSVKPAKDPHTGGYMYLSVLTGQRVDPHSYEDKYLTEVHYSSEFLSENARNIWEIEAEGERERRAALLEVPGALQLEVARHAAFKSAKVSWWDQDVEEGFGLEASIALGSGLGLEANEDGLAGLPSSEATSTTASVGSLLQNAVLGWVAAVQDARVEAVVRAMDAAEQAALASAQQDDGTGSSEGLLEDGTAVTASATPIDSLGSSSGASHEAAFSIEEEAVDGSNASVGVSSSIVKGGMQLGVSDLGSAVRAALPGLLAPIEAALGCPAEEGHVAALHDSLISSLAAFASARGVAVEGFGFSGTSIGDFTGVAGGAEDGEGMAGQLSSTLPFGFSLGDGNGLSLEATQGNGYSDSSNGYDHTPFDYGAESEGILQDAIRAFAQEQQQQQPVQSQVGPSALSGILLQLLPGTTGADGFPAARLFEGGSVASTASTTSSSASLDKALELPPEVFAGPLEEGEVPETSFSTSFSTASEADVSGLDDGFSGDLTVAMPLAVENTGIPFSIRIQRPQELLAAGVHGVTGSSTNGGRPDSPSTGAVDDDTHGAAVAAAVPEILGGVAPSSPSFGANGVSSDVPAVPTFIPLGSTVLGTTSGVATAPPAAVGTPGRIAPTMLKVFSPQQASVSSSGLGQSGKAHTSNTGASIATLAMSSPGLAARVKAATAYLSLPTLPQAWSAIEQAGGLTSLQGDKDEVSSNGSTSLPPLNPASPSSGRASTGGRGGASAFAPVIPMASSAAAFFASSSVNTSSSNIGSSSSFSARAAEALRLFDAAVGPIPMPPSLASTISTMPGVAVTAAQPAPFAALPPAAAFGGRVSPSLGGPVAAQAQGGPFSADARQLVKAVSGSPSGTQAQQQAAFSTVVDTAEGFAGGAAFGVAPRAVRAAPRPMPEGFGAGTSTTAGLFGHSQVQLGSGRASGSIGGSVPLMSPVRLAPLPGASTSGVIATAQPQQQGAARVSPASQV